MRRCTYSSALAWERAAFIRARSCAGDIAAGEAFLDRYPAIRMAPQLSFGAIDEVRRLTLDPRGAARACRTGSGLPSSWAAGHCEVEFSRRPHSSMAGAILAEARDTRSARCAGGDRPYRRKRRAPRVTAMTGCARSNTGRRWSGTSRPTASKQRGAGRVARLRSRPARSWSRRWKPCPPVRSASMRCWTRTVYRFPKPPCAGRGQSCPRYRSGTGGARGRVDQRQISGAAQFGRWAVDAVSPTCWHRLRPRPTRMPQCSAGKPDRASPQRVNLFRLLEARPGLFALLADCLTLAPPPDELARRPDLLVLIDRTALDLPGGVEELRPRWAAANL